MPAKQKKENGLKKLKQDLKDNQVGQLYLFPGAETYLRQNYLESIKKQLLTPGFESFQLHLLTGKEVTPKLIRDSVDSYPLGGERSVVQVTDYDLMKAPADQRDELTDLLEDLPDYVCLVFIYDILEYKADARMKLTKLLQEKGTVVEFAKQSQSDLVNWIQRRFKALDRDIDGDTARYMIFLCGDLMNALSEEIAKAAAYAKQHQVTRQDIEAVAIPQLDAKVFQMTDALINRKFDLAAQVLGDLFSQQEAPIMIVSVLGKQLRQLYTARLAFEQRKGSQYLVQLWKLHPYPAENRMNAAPKFDLSWCRHAVSRAAEVDLQMKSTGLDQEDLLTRFLMELAYE